MHNDVAIVANNSHPGFIAATTAILKWPDRTQAIGYVLGMRILENIQRTGVFRELPEKEIKASDDKDTQYFGDAAMQAVDRK